MITLITAVPGSGKTLYAVSIIQGFLNEGRPVYHNIDGLQADKFENNHLLFDAPADWTETPDGSVVIYDECQQEHLYPATGQRGQITDKRLTAMETHRHTGHDLYFITQAPTFVHHHVRKLVGQHIHFYRGGGAKSVARYTWSHTCENPNDRAEQQRADFQIFRFDPKLYDLYKSATVHTHKFRIPKKIIFISLFILALLAACAYLLTQGFIFNQIMDNGQKQPAAKALVAAAADIKPASSPRGWLNDVPETRPVSGCISSARSCQCFTHDLVPLDMSQDQCRAFIKSPLPFRLHEISKSSST